MLSPKCFLALVLASLPVVTLAADAAPAAGQPAAKPEPVKSFARSFASMTPKPTPVGLVRPLVDAPSATLERFECHVTVLNAGKMSHPPHRHAIEEFIVLLEGSLDVHINGTLHRANPGGLFFLAANDVHNVTNVGDVPALYAVFNAGTAATRAVRPAPAAEWTGPGVLRSAVFNWEDAPVTRTKVGERRAFFDAPTATLGNLEGHATTLAPGEAPHPPHQHPDEEIVLVKEGSVEVTIGEAVHRGERGSIFFLAANDRHGLRNVGATPATYYVFRIVAEAPRATTVP